MNDPSSLESIFFAALEKRTPADRLAYLDEACNADANLRHRVERMLAAQAEAGSFLETPLQDFAIPDETPDLIEAPGTTIGPYKLLQQIGEGGFGVVFMAEQTKPVHRTVALKIIKPGMDTRHVIARFEAERQALALMDHPNIAKVLDAGTTESGRPYFVMELVKGVPITRYCDEKRLSLRERLDLFIPVCQAVQHAHQKGIIHRDIKPTNVVVAEYDNHAVPKVIDFGVAKATAQKLTERTMFTEFGQVIGTVEYMSPEQAKLNQLDIDTRSDIYSLGVLLYELLAGSTPFEQKRLREAAFDEVLRIIREEEPPKPSTKLSTSDTLPSIAANRHTESARLSKDVRGELDWIVMKCLEKDRNRRYETANGLVRDIERYLHDEPVEACPPSAAYRARRFLRRYKRPVLAASVVVLTLVGGIIATTWQAIRAEQARQAEAEQRKLAEVNEKRAEEEKQIAQAVSDFLQQDLLLQADSFEQADRGFSPEPNLTVREALNRAAAKIGERFPTQPLVEAAIRLAIGQASVSIGEDALGLPHLERARALRVTHLGTDHPDTLYAMGSLAWAYRNAGQFDKALPIAEETVARCKEKLGADHPQTLRSMNQLGWIYRLTAQIDKAETLGRETLALCREKLGADAPLTLRSMRSLALAYRAAGKFDQAVPLLEESLAKHEVKFGADHPETLLCASNLSWAYLGSNQLGKALPLMEGTLPKLRQKFGADHPFALQAANDLGWAYQTAGQFHKALALFEETLATCEKKLGPDDDLTLYCMAGLSWSLESLGQLDKAFPLVRERLARAKAKFGPDHRTTLRSMYALAAVHQAAGQFDDAQMLWEEALAKFEVKFGRDHVFTLDTIHELARTHQAAGRLDQADALLREAIARYRQKVARPWPNAAYALASLGWNLLKQERYAEAESICRESLAVHDERESDAWEKFYTQSLLGAALLGQQKYADAEPLLVQGYEGMKQREATIPVPYKFRLTEALERLVRLYDTWGKNDESAKWRKELEEKTSGQ